MAQVSKRELEKKMLKGILKEYTKFVLSLRYRKSDVGFFEEFFTKTERLMFAKRLAIIALLLKGANPGAIGRNLKVSPSTIARIQHKLANRVYRGFEDIFKRFLGLPNSSDDLLLGFMPTLHDRGMWKRIRGWERPE